MLSIDEIKQLSEEEKIVKIQEYLDELYSLHPIQQPIGNVKWVKIEEVSPNDYNPNSVASKEMGLLYTSILQDGYTQPIVTIYDPKVKKYIIVDGFHRYFTAKSNSDILERNKGRIPIVVINKNINERMAATVRHNRARGSHSIDGMTNMVFEMLKNGWEESKICNHLGLEAEELLRLKYTSGFAKLFEKIEYNLAWVTKEQIMLEKTFKNND